MFLRHEHKDIITPSIKILTDKSNQLFAEYVEQCKKDVTLLQKNAFNVAYQISMPLLASAQQHDEKRFFELLPKMQQALQNVSDHSLAAWLWGRIYLATIHIGIKAYSEKANAEKQLKTLLTSKNTEKNAFSSWAWGYFLSDTRNSEYKQYSQTMFNSVADLSKTYINKKADIAKIKLDKEELDQDKINKNQKELQNLSTDAIWGWVMALQAAANHAYLDEATQYDKILKEMKEMTGQSTVAAALAVGLTVSDYPAWAVSIVRLAAVTAGDDALYMQLEKPLKDSIRVAKISNHLEEEVLANINSNIAIAQWNEKHSEKNRSRSICTIL